MSMAGRSVSGSAVAIVPQTESRHGATLTTAIATTKAQRRFASHMHLHHTESPSPQIMTSSDPVRSASKFSDRSALSVSALNDQQKHEVSLPLQTPVRKPTVGDAFERQKSLYEHMSANLSSRLESYQSVALYSVMVVGFSASALTGVIQSSGPNDTAAYFAAFVCWSVVCALNVVVVLIYTLQNFFTLRLMAASDPLCKYHLNVNQGEIYMRHTRKMRQAAFIAFQISVPVLLLAVMLSMLNASTGSKAVIVPTVIFGLAFVGVCFVLIEYARISHQLIYASVGTHTASSPVIASTPTAGAELQLPLTVSTQPQLNQIQTALPATAGLAITPQVDTIHTTDDILLEMDPLSDQTTGGHMPLTRPAYSARLSIMPMQRRVSHHNETTA